MDLVQFNQSIKKLFKKELLEGYFEDDFGFTHMSNNNISKIGYCTNLSLETIEIAAKNNVDLMITHHDAWDFIYELKDYCIKKLEEYRISHFWIHSPLDYVDFGTCTSLMKVLGINNIINYSYFEEVEFPGIGEFSQPICFEALVEKMRYELNEPVRAWRNNSKEVKRVGVLTGAGHSSDHIRRALKEGCDTYITGEATLYTIQYAQFVGINLLVGSHTFTEIFGVESLVEKIKDLNHDIEIMKLEETHFELITDYHDFAT
jgi:dinuclear metal center YbgI/SA1388 family protein